MRKRIIALVMSIVMILGVLPFSVFADETANVEASANEVYLLDVPETISKDYYGKTATLGVTTRKENEENFIVAGKEGFGNGDRTYLGINGPKITYGDDAIGLPDSDLSDVSSRYIAIRIKINDNTPAFEYQKSELTIQLTNPNAENSGAVLGNDGRYFWLDLNDGSMIQHRANGFEFVGDMDGWLIIAASNNAKITEEFLENNFTGITYYFEEYPQKATSQTDRTKKSSWGDKEVLIGDVLLVKDRTVFATEHCAQYSSNLKYAPNGGEDTAYYALRVTGNYSYQYTRQCNQVGKTVDDPTVGYIGDASYARSYLHTVTLPNGDRALEISLNSKVSILPGSDGLSDTLVDISAGNRGDSGRASLTIANTYEGSKDLSYSHTNVYSGAKLNEEILNNSDYFVFRVATTGLTESYAITGKTNAFLIQLGLAHPNYGTDSQSKSMYAKLMVETYATYIDANTGDVSTIRFYDTFTDFGKAAYLKEDIDGYIIIPRSSFTGYTSWKGVNIGNLGQDTYSFTEGTTSYNYTFAQLWGGRYQGTSGKINDAVQYVISNTYYRNPTSKIYAGDVYFVSDPAKFEEYHTSCKALGHDYEVTDSKEPTEEEDGYKTYTCQREGCGDTYTEVLPKLDCTHANTKKEGTIAADCLKEGHTGATICIDCGKTIDEGSVVEALGHKEIAGEGKEPTCTEKGYESSVVCERCGELLEKVNEIPEIPHKFEGEGTKVAPTETQSGYTKYTCDYGCGEIYKTAYVMPLSSEVKNVKAEQIVKTMDLRVTWDAIEGADMYLVYVYDVEGKQIRGATITDGRTSVRIDGFAIGNYTVKVRARVGGKYTTKYDAVEVAFGSILPEPPIAEILYVGKENMILTWDAIEGAVGYYVEFLSEDQRFAPYTDTNYIEFDKLRIDTEYKISICIKMSDTLYIPFGQQVTVRTDNHADINLSAIYNEDGILVSWDVLNEVDDSTDMHWVYRIDESGKWNLIAATEGTSVFAQSVEGKNKFGIIARVKDKHGIYRYIPSEEVETCNDEVLSYTPVDTTGMTDLQKAVVLTAESFYLRGARGQYDMTNMITTSPRNPERRLVGQKAPEDYTLQNIGYTDCSGFVYDAFYNALNMKIVSSIDQCSTQILASSSTNLVMRRWPLVDTKDFDTEEERQAKKEEFYSKIQPGDAIVYRYEGDAAGHVMLYVGNGMMIHAYGGDYKYATKEERYEPEGVYLYDSVEEKLFNPESRLYLFNKHKYTILRPINSFTGEIPAKTLSRVDKMRGIVAEKLASHTYAQTVNLGEEITYTFAISNYSNVTKTLSVKDTVPANTTYVSGAEAKDGNSLSWNVTVPAGQRVEVSYTVKVNEDASLIGKAISSSSTVDAIAVNCPKIYVGNTLTKAEQQEIIKTAESNTSELSDLALADAIYKEAIGKSSLEGYTSEDALNGVFDYVSTNFSAWPKTYKKLKTSGTFITMLAPNMYGGKNVTEENRIGAVANARTRMVMADKLVIGDIIICNDAGDGNIEDETYLYLGDMLLNLSTKESTELSFLDKCMGYRHFCVIRPSLGM